ncbi:hypothetical protein [Halarsenatibacter silvermanii]|uniref:Uncharacterized protein n=1 Tax=Halarsenatibacter silvermanii TaxID=321763 RepID=A0A1G9SKS1_9FIRM|nr:hypothetical protein [Halarsenatibacter silvermanii]SDM36021.1 hypothetical protein SAMN04488692_12930 [Halarsenatibacter silvermanii]
MHKYERFIIYPLLIAALFYGFSGGEMDTTAQKYYDEILSGRITAENITVTESLDVLNEEGKFSASLTQNPEGKGELILNNSEGEKRIKMGTGRDGGGGGMLSVYNNHGNIVIHATQTLPDDEGEGGGHGGILIYDRDGEEFRSYDHTD